MPTDDKCALESSGTKCPQLDLVFLETSESNEDHFEFSIVRESDERVDLERPDTLCRDAASASIARKASAEHWEVDEREGLDVLGLQQACVGVLHSFWYEIRVYADQYGVSENALVEMVETEFLKQLDYALLPIEEETRPLTRANFLRVLRYFRRIEAEKAEIAANPYRNEKWDELVNKARGRDR